MPVDALDPAFSPHAGSESDSDLDSGYSSLNDDPREPTGFYDDLLTKFENEGPTLANHGKNTKKNDTRAGGEMEQVSSLLATGTRCDR